LYTDCTVYCSNVNGNGKVAEAEAEAEAEAARGIKLDTTVASTRLTFVFLSFFLSFFLSLFLPSFIPTITITITIINKRRPVAILLGTSYQLAGIFNSDYWPFFWWLCIWTSILHLITAMIG
jgi:hypothetical protein